MSRAPLNVLALWTLPRPRPPPSPNRPPPGPRETGRHSLEATTSASSFGAAPTGFPGMYRLSHSPVS